MNFSDNRQLKRLLSLILAVVMMTTLFAGCKKDENPEDTSEGSLNLNLSETETPTETQTDPPETTAPAVNENSATVTSQLNIRSSPSTEATVVGTLQAGDKVEVSRREEVTGINWAYIISPTAGWVVMDFVEMDIPSEENTQEDTSTPAGEANPSVTQPSGTTSTSIKGVINANGLNIRSEASTNGKVQGAYNKGDVVTILETKNGWGRTNKGWIKMEYVTTTGGNTSNNTTTNNTTTNNTTNNNTSNITSNGSTTVVLKGVVKVNELNIRTNASTNGDRVGMYRYGDRVEILEKSGSWGRTNKGWIHLDYIYQDGTAGDKTANGTVTGDGLNIRSGPGTGYGAVGSYNSGDKVTILEQFTYNGVTWGCTNRGWISMQYVSTDGSAANNNNNSNNSATTTAKSGSIIANGLNIRSGAGTGYAVVGSLNYGDRVTILSEKSDGNTIWGQISSGWISMEYVKPD